MFSKQIGILQKLFTVDFIERSAQSVSVTADDLRTQAVISSSLEEREFNKWVDLFVQEATYFIDSLDQPRSAHESIFSEDSVSSVSEDSNFEENEEVANSILKE